MPVTTKTDIPSYKKGGGFDEGQSPKAKLHEDVLNERNKRRYIRKEGGFTKGLSDEEIASATELLLKIGVSKEDIDHDLALMRSGQRTGTERIRWCGEIRVPGMENVEALAPRKIEDTRLLQNKIIQQGEKMEKMLAKMEEMASTIAELKGDAKPEKAAKPDKPGKGSAKTEKAAKPDKPGKGSAKTEKPAEETK